MKNPSKNTVYSAIKQATATVLITVLPSLTLTAGQLPTAPSAPSPATRSAASSAGAASGTRPRLLSLVSPQPDDHFVSARMAITLQISRYAYRDSLSVKLNGKEVTPLVGFNRNCTADGCTETAPLTLKAGLQPGENTVQIRIDSQSPWFPSESKEFSFNWKPPSPNLGLADSAIALAPALGFTTVSTGGQYGSNPWFQIYSNALNGGTMSYPAESPCTGVYQIVAINRQTLQEDSYACYGDDASFASALAALNPSDPTQKPDLVIAGTTWYNNAGAKLNTTSIGGTDYSKYASADQPLGYMIIGVPGAAAGSAYETYYVSSNDNSHGDYNPRLNGILAIDSNDNYNFFEYDAVPYSVDADKGVITVNGYTYTPPTTVQNGLWLLQLDRWSLISQPACPLSGNSVTDCGQVFDTGNADPQTATQAMTDLQNALNSASHKNLLFLTTIGTNPFAALPDGNFALTIETLGFPANTFNSFASGNITNTKITLVTSSDPNFSKAMIGGNAVVSSGSYFNQGQTGSVYGVLSRDQHSFYRPVSTVQGAAAPSSGSLGDFFSMYQIPWTQPGAWDSLASANLQAAYRYLSYTLIQSATNGNRKSDDIHSLYVSSLNNLLIKNNAYPDATKVLMPLIPWMDPIDNQSYTFLPGDLNTEAKLINNELGNLNQSINFVTNIEPYIGNNTSAYVLAILGAASNMATELDQPQSTTSVSVNLSNVANFAGALFSLAALGFDSEDEPILGVMSGLLWAAGSAQLVNPAPSAIPNPWGNVTTTISDLSTNAGKIAQNAANIWNTVQDNAFSDQAKLTAFAYNSDNSWSAKNKTSYSNVQTAMQNSANLSFYTQMLASLNAVDFYGAYPYTITDPSQIYTLKKTQCDLGQCFYTCDDVYGNSIAQGGWNSWPSIGPKNPSVDYYVIGGPISNNGSNKASETMPNKSQITTLFGNGANEFNLSPDMFYSLNGPLKRRTGYENLNYGYGFCKTKGDDVPADTKPR
ncbi:MAG: hypothetical protein JO185_17375 [Acidobacteriaceae bacterium]|nr:hypothetical protein [Acidobacteriaceae bacterium]